MIYGALLFEKSGLPIQAYLEMLLRLNPVLHDYLDVVRKSICTNDFSNPQASVDTIRAAYVDALTPFRALEVNHDLPALER